MTEEQLIAGRYRLGAMLGRGGMGVVWRATDEFLEREVAIKEMRLPVAPGPETAAAQVRTMREARSAARLSHPAIITVHDVITHDDRPWIVMELIDGPSLSEVVQRDGPLPRDRVADIAVSLLTALDVAHRKGIAHRDVKPANVLIDGDRVVLTDFGIAAIDGATALTATNQIIGSPQYLAPERISDGRTGPPGDLWSLGVTLYVALTGRTPFERPDTQAVLAAVLTQAPAPLSGSEPIDAVVEGLLRKEPGQRLTAAEALDLLGRKSQEDTTVSVAVPPAPTKSLPRPRGRRRAVILTSAAVVVVALAGFLVWQTLPDGDRDAGSPTTTVTPIPAPDGYVEYDETGFTIAIPTGWERLEDPVQWLGGGEHINLHVTVYGLEEAPDDLLGFLEDYEETEVAGEPYHDRVRLAELDGQVSGGRAAELEYVYALSDAYYHEVVRLVVSTAGHAYYLKWWARGDSAAAAQATTREHQDVLTAVLGTFDVA